jgi:hypothetical protein
MSDENAGTSSAGDEAQEPSEGAGTPPVADEVTTLRSRNAGLDAKVTALTKERKEANARAEAAEAKLAEYEAGRVGADEALRAQLAAKDAELNAVRKDAHLARIEAQYPETFAVLGEAAAGLSAEKLAEAEARFTGVEAPAPTPKPVPNNSGRNIENPAEETSEDILRRLSTFEVPR